MSTRSAARAPRGLSLAEVMVAAFLGSLVLYVLVSTLIPALRASAMGTARVSLDQRGTLAASRLIRALKASNRAGLFSESADGVTLLSAHPLEGILADSKQKWAAALIVFSWRERKLEERQMALTPPVAKAMTLPFAELQQAFPAGQLRFTVDKLSDFSVVLGEGPRVDFRLRFEDGKDQLEIARTVFLNNSSQ